MDGPPTPEQDLAWRLDNVEARLEAISERLGRIESSLRSAVADEIQGATAELRRAISELGRRLVQDLPHELRRHRDAIVAELRPPAPPPPTAADLELLSPDDPAAAQPPGEEEPVPAESPAEMADADVAGAADTPERRRAHRLRRWPS